MSTTRGRTKNRPNNGQLIFNVVLIGGLIAIGSFVVVGITAVYYQNGGSIIQPSETLLSTEEANEFVNSTIYRINSAGNGFFGYQLDINIYVNSSIYSKLYFGVKIVAINSELFLKGYTLEEGDILHIVNVNQTGWVNYGELEPNGGVAVVYTINGTNYGDSILISNGNAINFLTAREAGYNIIRI